MIPYIYLIWLFYFFSVESEWVYNDFFWASSTGRSGIAVRTQLRCDRGLTKISGSYGCLETKQVVKQVAKTYITSLSSRRIYPLGPGTSSSSDCPHNFTCGTCGSGCENDPVAPEHGKIACSCWLDGKICEVTCNECYDFRGYSSQPYYLLCDDSGQWISEIANTTLSCKPSKRPEFRNCPSNINAITKEGEISTKVYWTEPSEIHRYRVRRTHRTGQLFYVGATTVAYLSENLYGETDRCVFKIIVSDCPHNLTCGTCRSGCENDPVAPEHGKIACSCWLDGKICEVTCNEGYDFRGYSSQPYYLLCDDSGQWISEIANTTLSCKPSKRPEFRNCPSNINAITKEGEISTKVYWTEPSEIHRYRVRRTHRTGQLFYVGETTVAYLSENLYGETDRCVFKIIIVSVPVRCKHDPVPPEHGAITCDWWIGGQFCHMKCDKGYDSFLDFPINFLLVCGDNGEWKTDLVLPKLSCFKSYAPPPMFRNCPCDMEVVADYGEIRTKVYWKEPIEIHQYSVEQTHRTGELFYIGETKVAYVSKNENGDIENCDFNITVSATYCPTLSFKEWNYTCFKGFMYGSICYRICPAGFILPPRENGVIMCQKNRTWTREFPDCIDVTKPIIDDCVPYQTAIVEVNSTGKIKWREPKVMDNADKDITLLKLGYISQGDHVREGKYHVYYTAQDQSGNVAEQCNIELSMKVLNCPVLHNDSVLSVECPDGFQNGGECFFTCRDGFKLIGHNKTSCKVAQDFDYAEWDFNDKHPYCEVLRSCEESDLVPPNHGNITCDSWLGGKLCFVKCEKDPFYDLMVCGNSGNWELEDVVTGC